MAIIKTVETPQGVSATYHKLLKAEVNAVTETVEMIVAIFASPEARAAGKGALWHEYLTIPFTDFTEDPRALLYPMLAGHGLSTIRGGTPDSEGTAATYTIRLTDAARVAPPTP